MICYFSGTGNSKYVACRISEALADSMLVNLNDVIKKNNKLSIDQGPVIIVTPTYAWRIPAVVEKLIRDNAPYNNIDAYFVMTCGGEIGNAGKYVRALCTKTGLNHKGVAGVVMPENYIAMFSAPDSDTALNIVNDAEKSIDSIISVIRAKDSFPQSKLTLIDRLYSNVVNPVFYSFCVKDKSFYAKDNCISCKKCAALCPLNNIKIVDGKPLWQGNCTHCMACICGCPTQAIEYGKKSVNQPRYHCPKQTATQS